MEVVTVHRVFQQEDKTSKLHSGEIFDQSWGHYYACSWQFLFLPLLAFFFLLWANEVRFLAISSQNTIVYKQRYRSQLLREEEDNKELEENWPFYSCFFSLCQNESLYETIPIKMCFPYRFVFMQIKSFSYERFCTRPVIKQRNKVNSQMTHFMAHQVWFSNSRTKHQNDILVKYFKLEVISLVDISCIYHIWRYMYVSLLQAYMDKVHL